MNEKTKEHVRACIDRGGWFNAKDNYASFRNLTKCILFCRRVLCESYVMAYNRPPVVKQRKHHWNIMKDDMDLGISMDRYVRGSSKEMYLQHYNITFHSGDRFPGSSSQVSVLSAYDLICIAHEFGYERKSVAQWIVANYML